MTDRDEAFHRGEFSAIARRLDQVERRLEVAMTALTALVEQAGRIHSWVVEQREASRSALAGDQIVLRVRAGVGAQAERAERSIGPGDGNS